MCLPVFPFPLFDRKANESSALKLLIANTETSFAAQMREKQSLIEQTHLRLRESAASLAEERRRLDSLRQKAEKRQHLRSRISNLKEANEAARTALGVGEGEVNRDVRIGEADGGLDVDVEILPLSLLPSSSGGNQKILPGLMEEQTRYVAALPSGLILRTRVGVYRRLNERLEGEKRGLGARSQELEGTLRQVLALCTGVGEERVGEVVGGLEKAVKSEGRLGEGEVGRVREFLRRVEGARE